MQVQLPPSGARDNLYISQNVGSACLEEQFRIFQPRFVVQYNSHCDDFGPANISCILRFVNALDEEFASNPGRKIVFCVEKGKKNLTNAVFLVGSYMIFKENMTALEVRNCFGQINTDLLKTFRTATHEDDEFDIRLIDCWRGLAKAIKHGWLRNSSPKLGISSVENYLQYGDPAQGDLHEVVPGKFIAFKGPVDLGDGRFCDTPSGVRLFSPCYYADILRERGVSTVVRLNRPCYDAAAFTSRGFEHFDLPFDDCAAPPDGVVAAFLRIADAAPGAVAVHCGDGLGRTGTLIALHLMRSHGFAAREAVGWLRIARPGSVGGGAQQGYLRRVSAVLRAGRRRPDDAPGARAGPPARGWEAAQRAGE